MDQAIIAMLDQYSCKTDDDYQNALKEIIQQIALLGLWRAKFFEHAAFYGGTALRILYQLDRFSEDLDFSLLAPNNNFHLAEYLNAMVVEMNAFGFEMTVSEKQKTHESAVKSAFLKANTQEHLILVNAPAAVQNRCHGRAQLKIKLELDTDPPGGFITESLPVLMPIPFWVKTYTSQDLFAGKISAVLCREWQSRIKGRDWYDFLWFIQRGIPFGLGHLEQRLRAVGYYQSPQVLTQETVKQMLIDRTNKVDLSMAKNDIVKFIKDPSRLDGWSKEVFLAAIERLKFL